VSYKPRGHNSVSPYLIVRDTSAVVAFLRAVFGAELAREFHHPDGAPKHTEVRIDDSVVMLGQAPEGYEPPGIHVHLYMPDVDAAYQRAIEAGAQTFQTPEQHDDPDRRCGVTFDTVTWWIGTQVS